MFSNKTKEFLQLSDEQKKKLAEIEKNEKFMREALRRNGVIASAQEKILAKTDLSQVNRDEPELIDELIQSAWKDFII